MTWYFSAIVTQQPLEEVVAAHSAFFADYNLPLKERMFHPSTVHHDQLEWQKWLDIAVDPLNQWTVVRWYQPFNKAVWPQAISQRLSSPLFWYVVDEQRECEHFSQWHTGESIVGFTRVGDDTELKNGDALVEKLLELAQTHPDEEGLQRYLKAVQQDNEYIDFFDCWQEWMAPLSVQDVLRICDECAVPYHVDSSDGQLAGLFYDDTWRSARS